MRENLVMSYLLSFCFFYVNLGLSRSLSRRFIHSVFSSFVWTKQKSFGTFFRSFRGHKDRLLSKDAFIVLN